jgi:hypothetical protein
VTAAPLGLPARIKEAVNRYVEAVKDGMVKRMSKNPKDNMMSEQREAMNELVEKVRRGEWAVRLADKGGGITVERKKCIDLDANMEMNKRYTYKEIEETKVSSTEKKVKEKLNGMKLNRKIHKQLNHNGRYQWRAYVSGIGTATESVAGLVEHEMKEGVQTLESYVEDSADFL